MRNSFIKSAAGSAKRRSTALISKGANSDIFTANEDKTMTYITGCDKVRVKEGRGQGRLTETFYSKRKNNHTTQCHALCALNSLHSPNDSVPGISL